MELVKTITDTDTYEIVDGQPVFKGIFKKFEIGQPKPKMAKYATLGSRLEVEHTTRLAEAVTGKGTMALFDEEFFERLFRHNQTIELQLRTPADAFNAGGYSLEDSAVLVTHITGYFFYDGSLGVSPGEGTEFPITYTMLKGSQGIDGQAPHWDFASHKAKSGGKSLW